MKRIPIMAVRKFCGEQDLDQVIVVGFSRKTGVTAVATFGKTLEDCAQAAAGGTLVKKA